VTKNTITKIFNWEHWPTAFFYVPNLPYSFYLAIRAKHAAFFSAVNPCIKSSGNGTESKYTTIQLVPKKHRPTSFLVTKQTLFSDVIADIKKLSISFPLIAKPDIGFRGLLVEKIDTENDLQLYLKKYPINILIQEFLSEQHECGIFYHRIPTEEKGKISSITLKRFLSVIGDGKSTLEELILADKRAKLYIDLFKKNHQNKLKKIPRNKKEIPLTVVGNHSKGTEFINGNYLISKKLEKVFDVFNKSIPGWYYGRIDIKYATFDELLNGHFKVLEINGIISEPTHIYDSEKYTYFKALKAIRTHWKFIFKIATINHKKYNVQYKSTKKFIEEMFELRAYIKKIKGLTNK